MHALFGKDIKSHAHLLNSGEGAIARFMEIGANRCGKDSPDAFSEDGGDLIEPGCVAVKGGRRGAHRRPRPKTRGCAP